MEVYTHRIVYKSLSDVFKIKPLFDIHYGNTACDPNELRKYLAESDKNTYFIGGGDWMDDIVVSDLRRYRKSIDASESEAIVDEQLDGLYDIIKPYKKQIIGIGRGNHEDTILKYCGTDSAKRMVDRLNYDLPVDKQIKYLGFDWLLKLLFRKNYGAGKTVLILGHHGWGGGSRTEGYDITKYSKYMNYFDADIFLFGHGHRKQMHRIPRLGLKGERLIAKPMLLALCGSFQKTFLRGSDASWAEMKGFPPVELGGLTINIQPTRYWMKYWVSM